MKAHLCVCPKRGCRRPLDALAPTADALGFVVCACKTVVAIPSTILDALKVKRPRAATRALWVRGGIR